MKETRIACLFFFAASHDFYPYRRTAARLLTGARACARGARNSKLLRRKKQGARRSAPSESCDYVSDRKGRWFESNLGSHMKETRICVSLFLCYILLFLFEVNSRAAVNWRKSLRSRGEKQQAFAQEETRSKTKRSKRVVRLCF